MQTNLTSILALALVLGTGCPGLRPAQPTTRRPARRRVAPPMVRPRAATPTIGSLLARLRAGRYRTHDCRRLALLFSARARRARTKIAAARDRFNEGLAWAHCGKLVRAIRAYRAALKAKRRYLPALINIGALHLRRNQEKQAYAALLGAFFADPLHLDAGYNLGVLFYRKARRRQPPSELLVRYWGRKKIKIRTSHQLALAHLRTVLAKSSPCRDAKQATLNLKAQVLVALLYLDAARGPKARSKLMQARLVLTSARRVLARPAVRGKYCKKASRATAFDTAVAQLHNARALLHLRQQDAVSAMGLFDQALRCDARFVSALLNRAGLALRSRAYWNAHDGYVKVVKLQPRNVEAVVGLGIAYRALATVPRRKGRPSLPARTWYARAIKQYKRALKIKPDAGEAMFNLAHLYMDYLVKNNIAERWYRKYLALPPAKTRPSGRRKATEALKEIAYQRRMHKKIREMERRFKARQRARRAPPRRRRPVPRVHIPPAMRPARGLSRSEIRHVIRGHRGEVLSCYSAGLSTDPKLKGTVKISFTINPSGVVGKASIASSTLHHHRTEACILAAVRRWRFPKAGAFVQVTYPFKLKPSGP